MGKELWSRPAPTLPSQGAKGAAVVESAPALGAAETAEGAAMESHQQLVEWGWCVWRCEGLSGDIIVVAIDDTIKGYPGGYPVYTLQELEDILVLDDQLLQAAHRAKKELGARISVPGGTGAKPGEIS